MTTQAKVIESKEVQFFIDGVVAKYPAEISNAYIARVTGLQGITYDEHQKVLDELLADNPVAP